MKTIVTQIRQKRLMALVLFLLVGMTSVFAQKQVNVSGRITDELNDKKDLFYSRISSLV